MLARCRGGLALRAMVVGTLGPATGAPGVLEALARSAMNVARVNLSHGEHAQRLNEPLAVLAGLPDPKFRVGALPAAGLRLDEQVSATRPCLRWSDQRGKPMETDA